MKDRLGKNRQVITVPSLEGLNEESLKNRVEPAMSNEERYRRYIKQCPKCYAEMESSYTRKCKNCGHIFTRRGTAIKGLDEALAEIKARRSV